MSQSRNIALSVVLFIALVSVWEAGVRILQVPQFILPAPSKVAEALWRGIVSGIYIEHLYYTLVSTVLGFILGSALGFGLGTGVAMSRRFEFFLYPYIVMFQSLPKIALAPLIVIWFGLGLSSKVVNAALVAFFPLLVNTIVGLQLRRRGAGQPHALARREREADLLDAPPPQRAALRHGGARRRHDLRPDRGHRGRVRRAPSTVSGMLIQSMNFTMDVSGQFSVLLILSVVGLILNRCISLIRKRVALLGPVREREGRRHERSHGNRHPARASEPEQLIPPRAQTKIVMGWCSRTISSATTPFAIATKMGWYKAEGIEVELVPLPGSGDCVKNVATREVAGRSAQRRAARRGPAAGNQGQDLLHRLPGQYLRHRRARGQFGAAVLGPQGQEYRRHRHGVSGVLIARALASTNGMNPDKDINVVVAGEGAQTAALLKTRQVDALSQYDTQYALVENAGVKLRMLDTKDIDRYPSNGFLASEETIKNKRQEMIASPRVRHGHGVRHRQSRGGRAHSLRGVPGDQAHRQGRGHGHPRRRQGAARPASSTGGWRRPG